MNTINERIKRIRLENGYTQKEFAEILKISQAHLSKIERGQDNISDSIIKLISITQNISFEWIKTGNGSMYKYNVKDSSISDILDSQKEDIDTVLRDATQAEKDYIYDIIRYFTGLITCAKATDTNDDFSTKHLELICGITCSLGEFIVLRNEISLLEEKKDYKGILEKLNFANSELNLINSLIKSYVNLNINKNKDIFDF